MPVAFISFAPQQSIENTTEQTLISSSRLSFKSNYNLQKYKCTHTQSYKIKFSTRIKMRLVKSELDYLLLLQYFSPPDTTIYF